MRSKSIPQVVLVCLLFIIYLSSMARGLTWANRGADGGDLITAAATGGVAHPSGYPTYLLLARLFQFIPVGSLAFRTNLLSAVVAIFAALVVYHITVNNSHNPLASLASACAIGLAPLLWSQAVIAEVYTLHVLFVVLILFLSVKDARNHLLLGLIFGLGMGNHITTIFLLPLLFHKQGKYLLRRLAGVILGASVYLTLPLRAMSHPAVNWGNPVTLENFIWLVSGDLYQSQLFGLPFAAVLERIRAAAALLLAQFGLIGLLLGFTGLIVCFKPTRLHLSLMWIALAFLIFPLIYGTPDSFLYLLPVFLCFAVWIGIGLDHLVRIATAHFPRLGFLIALAFLIILLIQTADNWPQVDAAHDQRAENFGREVMSRVPQDALVFAKGDQAVLALWYFHYALHERPDVVVVATELLENKWYQQTLRDTYPNLTLPDFFMFPEVVIAHNPGRTICYVEYDFSTQVMCQSR